MYYLGNTLLTVNVQYWCSISLQSPHYSNYLLSLQAFLLFLWVLEYLLDQEGQGVPVDSQQMIDAVNS